MTNEKTPREGGTNEFQERYASKKRLLGWLAFCGRRDTHTTSSKKEGGT